MPDELSLLLEDKPESQAMRDQGRSSAILDCNKSVLPWTRRVSHQACWAYGQKHQQKYQVTVKN